MENKLLVPDIGDFEQVEIIEILVKKGDKVKLVRFGDPKMTIKKDQPKRRKSFRARHKCDTNPPDKLTPRYWSCKKW